MSYVRGVCSNRLSPVLFGAVGSGAHTLQYMHVGLIHMQYMHVAIIYMQYMHVTRTYPLHMS